MSKIIYDGFIERNKIPFLCFKNEKGSRVEIPTDPFTAKHFLLHFSTLSPQIPNPVERGNDGSNDQT